MKKILIALMSIIITIGLVGLGTYAVFSDEDTSEDNTFAAGTLQLSVEGESEANESYTWENIKPGESAGWEGVTSPWRLGLYWEVKNTGTLDGILTVSVEDIVDEYWDGTGDPGDLSSLNRIVAGSGDPKLSTQLRPQVRVNGVWKTESSGLHNLNPFTIDLDAGETVTIAIAWGFQENAGNEYQGAKSTVDFNFSIEQK
jgi:spore coat-associated protein N